MILQIEFPWIKSGRFDSLEDLVPFPTCPATRQAIPSTVFRLPEIGVGPCYHLSQARAQTKVVVRLEGLDLVILTTLGRGCRGSRARRRLSCKSTRRRVKRSRCARAWPEDAAVAVAVGARSAQRRLPTVSRVHDRDAAAPKGASHRAHSRQGKARDRPLRALEAQPPEGRQTSAMAIQA